MNKNMIYVIIGGVVMVLIVAVLFMNNAASNLSPTSTQTPVSTATTEVTADPNTISGIVMADSSAVYVADQKPGNTVTVSTVFFHEPGYVMIHKSVNGQPGAIIGVSDYVESSKDMLEVTVDEALVDGEEYFAMLHKDDGNGVYDDAQTDAPITDPQGNIIMMNFRADADAEEAPAVVF